MLQLCFAPITNTKEALACQGSQGLDTCQRCCSSRGCAGTVIPSQDSLYATPSLAAFKQARGGQGLLVVGNAGGQVLGAAASVQLLDASGSVLAGT
jgi:hypothetical protein